MPSPRYRFPDAPSLAVLLAFIARGAERGNPESLSRHFSRIFTNATETTSSSVTAFATMTAASLRKMP